MSSRLDLNNPDEPFFDRVQLAHVQREAEQRDARQKAECDLLDEPGISFKEYRARRARLADLVAEPNLPLDEMAMADFKAARRYGYETRIPAGKRRGVGRILSAARVKMPER